MNITEIDLDTAYCVRAAFGGRNSYFLNTEDAERYALLQVKRSGKSSWPIWQSGQLSHFVGDEDV